MLWLINGADCMKAALYVRVSTSKQDADNQLAILKDYCEKSGWSIYKEFADVITGKEESRPAWDEMFRDAHKKLFDVMLFWSYDRFARSGTLFTLQKLHELELLGIGYKSYQEPYINSVGMFKETVISIFATLAKHERERISERTKAGLKCECGHSASFHTLTSRGCSRCICMKFSRTGAKRGKDAKVRKPRRDRGKKRKLSHTSG